MTSTVPADVSSVRRSPTGPPGRARFGGVFGLSESKFAWSVTTETVSPGAAARAAGTFEMPSARQETRMRNAANATRDATACRGDGTKVDMNPATRCWWTLIDGGGCARATPREHPMISHAIVYG